jgi:hypothetical protein
MYVWEGYYRDVSTIGSARHIKAVHTKVRCKTTINDFLSFFLPVV